MVYTNFVGQGGPAPASSISNGDGGVAEFATTNGPFALWKDDASAVYFSERTACSVRRVDDTTQIITTVLGNGDCFVDSANERRAPPTFPVLATSLTIGEPTGVVGFGDLLFVSVSEWNQVLVVDLTTGLTDLVAGTGHAGFSGDNGDATDATLSNPKCVARQHKAVCCGQ